MVNEAWQCDCFWSIILVRVRYDGDGVGPNPTNLEIVLGQEGASAGVEICTEMLSSAAYATLELSRMCCIAGYGAFFPQLSPRRDSFGSNNHNMRLSICFPHA
jgi:hypothetical protein